MKKVFTALLMITLTLAITSSANASKIKAVKGKKVLIDTQGEVFKKNEIYRVKSSTGKTTGLVKITRVAGKSAEGMLKGSAEKGSTLEFRAKKQKQSTSGSTAAKTAFGGIIGFNSANSDIQLPSGTTVELSGTGFSAKGLFDMPVFSLLWFRGMLGLEQFVIGGVSSVECGGECTAEINYLSGDIWARLVFGLGTFRPWLGGGAAIMFPLQKEASALSETSIGSTSIFAGGGGFDLMLSDDTYLPIQVDYSFYPKSEDVTANAVSGRIGFAKSF